LFYHGNIQRETEDGGQTENDFEGVAEDLNNWPGLIAEALDVQIAKEERARSSWLNGRGSFFYPPLWVGTKPKPKFESQVYGWRADTNKEIDLTFNGRRIVIDSRGFVAIESDGHLRDVHQALNLIFGCVALTGVSCYKVDESEILSTKIGPSEIDISSELPQHSVRARFSDKTTFKDLPDFKEISIQTLCDAIKQAELISTKQISSDFLLWFAAYNHLENKEYDQSFITSWIVVEKQLYRLFSQHLIELGRKKSLDKRKKASLERLQSVNTLLLFLRATNRINESDYGTLTDLNQKRNNFVHKGTSLTLPDSKKCLKCSERVIRDLISNLT
jgi:hypothetical protein